MSKRIAGGNIRPSRFVNMFRSSHCILQCGNNIPVVGVSHEKARREFFATEGEELEVYDEGAGDILLKLGGPVQPGNRLRSDAEGRGVAIELPGFPVAQHYGAIALENGVAGDKIHVFVTFGSHVGDVR